MFITLKCSSGHSDMEQVVARGASPGQDQNRVRPPRRPACLSCQSRKLRCTGPKGGDCDRCRARAIACVFPTSQARNNRSVRENRGQPVESGENALEPGDGARSPRPLAGSTVSASDNGGLEGNLSDMKFYNDVTQLLMDIEEEPSGNPQLDLDSILGAMDPGNKYPADLGGLQYVLDLQKPPHNLPFSAHDLSALLSLDALDSSNETSAQPAIQDLPISNTQNRMPSDSASGNNLGCPCIHSTVRVVQQLDDDDFRITSLSLDQVVQLQKWIISQCCKPLDCPNCKFLPTVHTVLVIVCDRLSEMFECISKRIKKANERLSGQSDQTSESTESTVSDYSTSSSTGCAGSNANCNPGLFSSEFQNTYTDEEQVHMIRVLLKLQLRNFRALLVRLDSVIQIAGSEARRARIKSLMLRLGRAATEIDNALRVVLQFFVIR
ncbi:hypothetical protein VTN77DRAFT_9357 [Rasamsonia byssochlamydoides]|uniref:uncharacterized protein n=1 Tax=Rasamsonia byssochlamydoides TaxID=89139 RepID=UPI0037425CAD